MINFVAGIIFGIVISTVGFSGIAHVADSAVGSVQHMARDATK